MSDKLFEKELQATLRHSEQDISPDLDQRIANARRAALLTDPKSRSSKLLWPAFTTAMATVVLVAVFITPDFIGNHVLDSGTDEQVANSEVDLYEELEFYQWLAENEAGVDDHG